MWQNADYRPVCPELTCFNTNLFQGSEQTSKKLFLWEKKNVTWLVWLLVIVLVIAAVVAKIKRSTRVIVFRSDGGPIDLGGLRPDMDSVRPTESLAATGVEKMVSCARCGIYIPTSEAIFRSGKVYCSEEHSNRN